MPRLYSSIKHHVVYCGVCWHSLFVLGEGQWQWEMGRAGDVCCKHRPGTHWWWPWCRPVSSQCLTNKGCSSWGVLGWKVSITITFVAEASLQSRSVWNGLYFENPQPEISSSHSAIPAWACWFPLAFHSLSSVSRSVTLKTSVHTRNCTPSSYPFHRSLNFIKTKCYCTVQYFFVVYVSFPPPVEVQWNTDSVFLSYSV